MVDEEEKWVDKDTAFAAFVGLALWAKHNGYQEDLLNDIFEVVRDSLREREQAIHLIEEIIPSYSRLIGYRSAAYNDYDPSPDEDRLVTAKTFVKEARG